MSTSQNERERLPNGWEVVCRWAGEGYGVVLAYNKSSHSPYVTWRFNPGSPGDTYWEHYFGGENAAKAAWDDFGKRVADCIKLCRDDHFAM